MTSKSLYDRSNAADRFLYREALSAAKAQKGASAAVKSTTTPPGLAAYQVAVTQNRSQAAPGSLAETIPENKTLASRDVSEYIKNKAEVKFDGYAQALASAPRSNAAERQIHREAQQEQREVQSALTHPGELNAAERQIYRETATELERTIVARQEDFQDYMVSDRSAMKKARRQATFEDFVAADRRDTKIREMQRGAIKQYARAAATNRDFPISSQQLPPAEELVVAAEWLQNNEEERSTVQGTLGVSASVGIGLSGGASASLLRDSDGNMALAVTVGVGGGLGAQASFKPSRSISYSSINGAEHVWDLGGWGGSMGATLGLIGGEVAGGVGTETYSISLLLGKAGLDFHAHITYTFIIPLNYSADEAEP